MRTNQLGKDLIKAFTAEYDPIESRTMAEKAVNLFVLRRLTNNQFSALVCLVMSIGIDTFRDSKMLKLLNTRSTDSDRRAALWFGEYIYEDNGKADRFLIKQREFEKDLFTTPEIVKS